MTLPSPRANYGGLTILRLGPALNTHKVKDARFRAAYQTWRGEEVPDSYNGYASLVTIEVFAEQMSSGAFRLVLGYTNNAQHITLDAGLWSEGMPLPQQVVDDISRRWKDKMPDGNIRKQRYTSISELCEASEKYANRNLLPTKGWICLGDVPMIVTEDMVRDALREASQSLAAGAMNFN